MTRHLLHASGALAFVMLVNVAVSGQEVTRKQIPGISTFAQVDTTIACGGATTPAAIREIARMGFKSVVNLRLANEPGAMVEEEGAEVRAAGMKYVHLPFDRESPDPRLIDNFIAAVTAPASTPAYVHCAAGGRAAALWMITRQGGRMDRSAGAHGGGCARAERPLQAVRAQLPSRPPVVARPT
jgi:uncharacterized protein (TIGR01244 family)